MFEDEFKYSYKKYRLSCSCEHSEFAQAIRSIGLLDKMKICPNCGSKMKAEFWPYPTAIMLGDKWTTDIDIIKRNFKGRNGTKMPWHKMEEVSSCPEN